LLRDRSVAELGYGRLLEYERPGVGLVAYTGSPEAPRLVRFADHPEVVRAPLHPGQPVTLFDGEARGTIQARQVGSPTETIRYTVELANGKVRQLDESGVLPAEVPSETTGALALLKALSWKGARAFHARAELRRTVSLWHEEAYGIPALLGTRVVPLAHQIHAARRVLTSREPRFLLADEVGLGKTIEAGLVIQALTAAEPGLRTLVIAPGAMTRQWLCELFLRFGEQVFVHVDATRLRDSNPDELFASERLIISTTALAAYPMRAERLLEQRWDLVVVDEAHQVPPDHDSYGLLRRLAERSRGLLALSATPGKRDETGLLGLLALVAPAAYDPADPAPLRRRLESQQAMADALVAGLGLVEAGADEAGVKAQAQAWQTLLPDDPVAAELGPRLDAGDVEALEELLAYVQEFHRLDHRLIRTRRATVRALGTELCERRLEVVRYPVPKSEQALVKHLEQALPEAPADAPPVQRALRGLYQRLTQSTPVVVLSYLEARRKALKALPAVDPDFDPLGALAGDPGPAEEEALIHRVRDEAPALPGEEAWLKQTLRLTRDWMTDSIDGCARVRHLHQWIKRHVGEGRGRKVLVFARERELVEELSHQLRDVMGTDMVDAIHHGLDEGKLSEVALQFQQGGLRVLISDELGGEGRNFQIASAVIHLDQPWATARLEQRIGRLDRMGRSASRPVTSVALVGRGATEAALLRIHREAFGVYERSMGGLEFLLPRWQPQVAAAACTSAAALEALVEPCAAEVAAERARADEALERTLDASRRSLDEAAEQAEVLAEADLERDVAGIQPWADRLGIRIKPLAVQVWGIEWSWDRLRRIPPGLIDPERVPEEGRVRKRGTFSREKALELEALELFAPGHPLIDALIRDVDASPDGRAGVFLRDLGPGTRGRLHLVLNCRTELDREAWGDEPMPPGLLYRAQTRLWSPLRSVSLALLPGKDPAAVRVTDRALRKVLEQTGDPAADRTLDRDELAGACHLPELWAAVDAGVELGLAHLREQRQAEVDEAVEALRDDLRHDLGYLRGVAQRAMGDERQRAEAEIALRERLIQSVANERLEIDAVALVIGS
jgi:superfamily II DNA or RNA helicase